jgi:hypothetical protein
MVKTMNVNAEIPASRELLITLPNDVPIGPAEIVVVISPSSHSQASTLGDLADSEFFGMWRERTDLGDSVEFARNLRSEAWKRSA